jgi:hypothetical protein
VKRREVTAVDSYVVRMVIGWAAWCLMELVDRWSGRVRRPYAVDGGG